MLKDINWLWLTTGFITQELSHLLQTLHGDKDLKSPRKLPTETQRIGSDRKETKAVHADHSDPELVCILIILPSTHSPVAIPM